MHHKRRLLIALVVTGALTAGLGSFAATASAQMHTYKIVLLGGITTTVTLPEGVAPTSSLLGIGNLPILSITDITPTTTTPGAPTTTVPTGPTADAPSAGGSSDQSPTAKKSGKSSKSGADLARGILNHASVDRNAPAKTPMRNANGIPTLSNPTTSLAFPGPAPVGVPNFFINKYAIPPFLLSIYQAAGVQYGVRWEVLAAINEIETDYGRNLNVSSAGAMGWMQFIPSSWKRYGVDANQDGKKDPYNPVDAIFAAARYLKAAGGDKDLRKAIFSYNHADWYVNSVLLRARLIGGIPADLIGSLSGLTQGQFPVAAAARYADDLSERDANRRVARGQNAAMPIEANKSRRGINIFAKAGSPVVAVQDGTITKVGKSARLGNYIELRDVYGNVYTYAQLKKVATKVPVPKDKTQTQASVARELALPKKDPTPTAPASAGKTAKDAVAKVKATATDSAKAVTDQVAKERLFANPTRPKALASGGKKQIIDSTSSVPGAASLKSYFSGPYGLDKKDVVLKPLTEGRKVIGGTVLGTIGTTSAKIAPHTLFEIRPAGRGAPRIDPKPILDGWKLLESTAIYRAQGKNAFFGPDAQTASIGQILLMSKQTLIQRVLANPRIDMYSCGRRDVASGQIDRRVLATLEFLAASGLKPTVSTLKCGHSLYTTSGNVSEHSSGNAVDIAKINGIPIVGNQGPGSITDITVRRLLTLQGTMKPHQIITLMKYDGTDNTLAMADHYDHIHVGFRPNFDPTTAAGRQADAVLKPAQWLKLIQRLNDIANPTVKTAPSKAAIRVSDGARASKSHQGE
jgi:murein DD-endopeptidase MepM/ murein hydrolase activator NlpD